MCWIGWVKWYWIWWDWPYQYWASSSKSLFISQTPVILPLSLSWRAAVGMPKKFQGENSKAATARARKAEAKAVADARKKQQEEDALWQETDKHVLKKEQRKVSCLSLWCGVAFKFCCSPEFAVLVRFRHCDASFAPSWAMCVHNEFALCWNKWSTNKERKINTCKHKMLAEQEGNLTTPCVWSGQKSYMWPLICHTLISACLKSRWDQVLIIPIRRGGNDFAMCTVL